MRSWIKWIIPIAIALPLIWLNHDQSMKLNAARDLEANSRQELEKVHAIYLQQEEVKSLKRNQRQLLKKVEQLAYLFVEQELPIPNLQGESVIAIRRGLNDYLDVRFWVPAGKRTTALVQKTEGVRKPITSVEDLLKVEFENTGWHSITSKFETSKSGGRLPLIVDGQEIHSIDLPDRKWNGGASYSPGSLPDAFHTNLQGSGHSQVNCHWSRNYYPQTKENSIFGYGVSFLKVEAAQVATSEILE